VNNLGDDLYPPVPNPKFFCNVSNVQSSPRCPSLLVKLSKGTDACGTFSSGAWQTRLGIDETPDQPGGCERSQRVSAVTQTFAFVVCGSSLASRTSASLPARHRPRQQFPARFCSGLSKEIHTRQSPGSGFRQPAQTTETARFCRGRAENSSSCRINPGTPRTCFSKTSDHWGWRCCPPARERWKHRPRISNGRGQP